MNFFKLAYMIEKQPSVDISESLHAHHNSSDERSFNNILSSTMRDDGLSALAIISIANKIYMTQFEENKPERSALRK